MSERFRGCSDSHRYNAKRYQLHGVPTCVLSNFFDFRNVHFPSSISRSAKPRLINTGSLFLERGVVEMADAFHLLRHGMDCQIALWGNFQPPELADNIRARILRDDTQVAMMFLSAVPFLGKLL